MTVPTQRKVFNHWEDLYRALECLAENVVNQEPHVMASPELRKRIKELRAALKSGPPRLKLFGVTHQCFATDHISYTTTLVYAKSKKAALLRYNVLAKRRREYPYMWNEVGIDSVEKAKVLR